MKKAFGRNYKSSENTAVFEFNLEDAYAVQSMVSWRDGFHSELQEAIDWLEERKATLDNRPGLMIVLVEEK